MVYRSEAQARLPGGHFVDPQVLARINNLKLVARTVVEGFITGLHRSPYMGFSIDFAEHRAYMPGDDIRSIDWRLYARTDKYFVKKFEADTNTDFMVLFDVSASMGYTTGGLTKFDYGRFLAASLTYFSRHQRDRVGLVTFDNDIVEYVPPSAKHLEIVLHHLERAEPMGTGEFRKPMRKIAGLLRRKGLVVVISDFYEDPEQVVNSITELKFRGNDVVTFHLLDPAELTLPFNKSIYFEDMESGEQIPVVPTRIREKYTEKVADHIDVVSKKLRAHQIDYTLLDTSMPLDFALFQYLSERQRIKRVR